MKKILLIAKKGLANISTLINIAKEEKAKNYQIKFFIDDYGDIYDPGRRMIKALGFDLHDGLYTGFDDSVGGLLDLINYYLPDIIVNESSITGGIAAKITRVSKYYPILRRFDFPGYIRNPTEEEYWKSYYADEIEPVLRKYSKKKISDPRELMIDKTVFVPSVEQFDVLPKNFSSKINRIFLGPKLWDVGDIPPITQEWLDEAKRSQVPIVLISFGFNYDGQEFLSPLLSVAERCNYKMLITYHNPEVFKDKYDPTQCHIAQIIPLRYVSQFCNVMVHHGGYQTSLVGLVNGIPTVTISTGNPEWEENGYLLESIGTSLHSRIPNIYSVLSYIESAINNSSLKLANQVMSKYIDQFKGSVSFFDEIESG